jgi:hypothetical protein
MRRSEQEATRVVRLWLEGGVTALPDRVLDDVLGQLPATPQRPPSRLAWRESSMNNTVGVALAAAAVVVIAVVAINGVLGDGLMGRPPAPASAEPSASPSDEPRATPLPSATSTPEVRNPESDFVLGRHAVTVDGVRFSFEIQASGWEPGNADHPERPYAYRSLNKSLQEGQAAEAIIYWVAFPDGAYADRCQGLQGLPADASAADVVDAVSNAPGTALVTGPSDVTIGGYPASHVVVSVVDELGCDPGYFYAWVLADLRGASWTQTLAGDTIRVWVVEVGDITIFIAGESMTAIHSFPEQQATLDREIDDIVNSIQFE